MASLDEILFEPPEMGCVLSLTGLPGNGSVIYDRSPLGHPGTIVGATWVRLPSGLWCLSFDGTDDYVSLGAGRFDDLTQATIEFWYRPDIDLDGQDTHRMLFNFYKDANNFIEGYYSHTANKMRLLANIGGAQAFINEVAGISDFGESQRWHYWVSVFGEHGGAQTWIDLDERMSTDADPSCIDDVATTTGNYLGTFDGSSNHWSGNIALFRIHNRRLSVLEIQNHFYREKHLFGL